jgi:hypothetical protein
MIITGTALSFLGLLDIGTKDIDVLETDYLTHTNRMYKLLGSRLPLVIVMSVYFGVFTGSGLVLRCVNRHRGGVWDEEGKDHDTMGEHVR